MGTIWNAAKRGEGYQLARESNITWVFAIIEMVIVGTFRFLSGRPMLGDKHRKTNATFLKRGTVPLDKKARPPSRWSYMPEGKRALIRLGLLTVVVVGMWLYFWHPSFLSFVGMSSAVVIPLGSIRPITRWWKYRKFQRVYLKPLYNAITPVLNLPPHYPINQCIDISPELKGLIPDLVKPMGKWQLVIRTWYGQWLEPIVRFVPERVMRAWWWLTGHYPTITKAWRHGK